MKCADPILCYDGKYRHFSLSTPTFKLLHTHVFDCGKCLFCRKKRSKELAIRCVLHSSLYPANCFLTLTYDETLPTYHNNFQYSDIQKFKKKLRRHCDYHLDKKIQIFNVHEYGKHGKKHWHLVVFNHDFTDKVLHTTKNNIPLYTSKQLEKLWPYGFSTVGNVTEASAMYQAQYTQKDIKNGNSNNLKKANSRHSGLGRDYFLEHFNQILRLGYIPLGGRKIPVPRYYQKLAHKHYSHFYESRNFFDYPERKRLFAPFNFRTNWPDKRIADLYPQFIAAKEKTLADRQIEWNHFINENAFNKTRPDFKTSEDNALYDLGNKTKKEEF